MRDGLKRGARVVVAAARLLVLLAAGLLAPGPAAAQRTGARGIYGTVVGHVSCADTNQPARLTSVTLQPIGEGAAQVKEDRAESRGAGPGGAGLSGAEPSGGGPSGAEPKPEAMSLKVYKTRLDGSFAIPRVSPGRYYVIVQKPGYLSPVAQFSREEIEHPNDETRTLIAQTVPMVAVNANESVNVDVRLLRAGTIGGVMRYDDGSAAPEMSVSLKRKGKDAKWVSTFTRGSTETDDQGRYRITGLPAGEYRLSTNLEIDDRVTNAVFGGSQSISSHTKYNLTFYFGDTFREKDARVLKLGDGEDGTGADFTIPVAKLHTVAGSLVDARSGRAINAGTIKLFTADDNLQMASAEVDRDEPTFRFDFLPEGEYVARVEDAREVTREEVPAPKDGRRPTFKETVVHRYGRYEAPLRVQTDATGVTLAIPEREAKGQKGAGVP